MMTEISPVVVDHLKRTARDVIESDDKKAAYIERIPHEWREQGHLGSDPDALIDRVWADELAAWWADGEDEAQCDDAAPNPLFESWDIKDLLMNGIPPVEWIGIPRVFVKGHQVALNAGSESGKSMLAVYLAVHMIHGIVPNGLPTPEGDTVHDGDVRILFLDKENPMRTTLGRFGMIEGGHISESQGLFYRPFPDIDALNTYEGAQQVLQFVETYQINFVVIDTQSKFVDGDENSSATFTELASVLFSEFRKRGITSLTLDHFGKDNSLRGSSAKKDNYDDMWDLVVVKPRDKMTGVAKLELRPTKDRTGVLPERIFITRTGRPQPTIVHEFSLERDHADITGEDLENAPDMPLSEKMNRLTRLLDANPDKVNELGSVNLLREWVIKEHNLSFTRTKMNAVIKPFVAALKNGKNGGSKGGSA